MDYQPGGTSLIKQSDTAASCLCAPKICFAIPVRLHSGTFQVSQRKPFAVRSISIDLSAYWRVERGVGVLNLLFRS